MARKQPKTADSLPLVAIDLGSDSVRAMAARRIAPDLFEILGVEERAHKQGNICIENGVITQSSSAGYVIAEVLKLLANRIGVDELPTAFVSIGGHSMQIAAVHSRRDQARKKEISQQLLDDMELECKNKIELRNTEVAVLGLVPSYFVLDGQEQDEIPNSMQRAMLVEAHYTAFCGRKVLDTQLQKAFSQAARSIEHAFVRPEALLSVFATCDGNHVLMDGCAVLDLGAQTSTLAVYKKAQKRGEKDVPGGIGEEDIVMLVLPYIRTAREGVARLGQLLEQYGIDALICGPISEAEQREAALAGLMVFPGAVCSAEEAVGTYRYIDGDNTLVGSFGAKRD